MLLSKTNNIACVYHIPISENDAPASESACGALMPLARSHDINSHVDSQFRDKNACYRSYNACGEPVTADAGSMPLARGKTWKARVIGQCSNKKPVTGMTTPAAGYVPLARSHYINSQVNSQFRDEKACTGVMTPAASQLPLARGYDINSQACERSV